MATVYDLSGKAYETGAQADGTTIGKLYAGGWQQFNPDGTTVGSGFYDTMDEVNMWNQRTADYNASLAAGSKVTAGPNPNPTPITTYTPEQTAANSTSGTTSGTTSGSGLIYSPVVGPTPATAPTTTPTAPAPSTATTAPAPATTPTTGGGLISTAPNTVGTPNLNQQVDAPTMTVEGRIQNLLNANNPVIRQAGDRAMAAFAQRGLLNSSMAIEAAQEAMISKAIEIAGPDAATYFKQSNINQEWTNRFAENQQGQDFAVQNTKLQQEYKKELLGLEQTYSQQNVDKQQSFALQQNYLQGISNLQGQYNTNIQAIQSSNMSAADKSAAIQDLTNLFAGQKTVLSSAFQAMPQWQKEWSDSWNISTGQNSVTPGDATTDPAIAPITYNGKTYKGPTEIADGDLTAMLTALVNDTSTVTDEQYAALIAEAQKRGLTVG